MSFSYEDNIKELQKTIVEMQYLIQERKRRNVTTYEMEKYIKETEELIKEWKEKLDNQKGDF